VDLSGGTRTGARPRRSLGGPAAYLTDPVIAADVEEEVDLFVLDKAAQDGEVTMGVSPRFWTAHERYGRPAKTPDRNAPGSMKHLDAVSG
jgi:hypothetical protein